jgi:cell division protein ZapA
MGAEVNRRIEGVRAAAGPSGEARMLVMAALLMADDIFDMQNRLAAGNGGGTGTGENIDQTLGRKLNQMARRAEEIAESLETHETE